MTTRPLVYIQNDTDNGDRNFPIGTILPYVGLTPPKGWSVCVTHIINDRYVFCGACEVKARGAENDYLCVDCRMTA